MEDGERTNFVTNGWKVLAEQDDSYKTTNRIVLGYGIIASDGLENGEDAYRYFHWNEHGDTEYITSADGQILNRYEYDAFGSLTTADEIIRNRYTYNGEQYDATLVSIILGQDFIIRRWQGLRRKMCTGEMG